MRQVSVDTYTLTLRREIREVVGTVQRLGWMAIILAILTGLWFAGFLLDTLLGIHRPDHWPCGPVWALGFTGITFAAQLYQAWHRRAIRRRLAVLTPLEREEIVRPLRAGSNDVGAFTRSVLRGLTLPAELAPAPIEEGRGDELAAS